MSSRKNLISAFTMILGVAVSSSVFATTLKQAVEETVDSNPDVLIAAKSRLATEQTYKQARAGYLPKVDLSADIGREASKNSSVRARTGKSGYDTLTRKDSDLTLTQLIFDGFGTPSEVAKRRASTRASAYEVAAVAQDLGLDATNAYLNILRNEELVSLAKANLSAHRRTFDMIKKRTESGLNREADVDQVTGRRALALANLQARQSDLRQARIEYLRIVGKVPSDISVHNVAHVSVPDSQEQVLSTAYSNHPKLQRAKFDVDAAQANYHVARALFYPRFNAEVGGSWNHNVDGSKGTDNDYFAMLRMDYNVYNGGGDVARVREARYLKHRAQEVYNSTERAVGESARQAWNDYRTAKERVGQLKQHQESARKSLAAYRKQFQLDKRTLLDLLDSENELFQSSNEYTNEKYNEMYARYRVLNSMGVLLQTLGVALPGEAYDGFGSRHTVHHAYVSHDEKVSYVEDEPVHISANTHQHGFAHKQHKGKFYAHAKNDKIYAQHQSRETQSFDGRSQNSTDSDYALNDDEFAPATAADTGRPIARAQSAKRDGVHKQQIASLKQNQQRAARDYAQARTQKAAPTPTRSGQDLEDLRDQQQPNSAQADELNQQADQPAKQLASWSEPAKQPAADDEFSFRDTGSTDLEATEQGQRTERAERTHAATDKNPWKIQVATFSKRENAQRLAATLRGHGYDVQLATSTTNGNKMNQVIVLPSSEQGASGLEAAQNTLAELRNTYHIQGVITPARSQDRVTG